MTTEVNAYRKLADNWPSRLINLEGRELAAEQTEQLQTQLAGYNDKVIEIGSGSGTFLIENARAHPSKLFVGVELRYKRSVRTIEKAISAGVENLIVIRAVSYTHLPSPRDKRQSRMPSSA